MKKLFWFLAAALLALTGCDITVVEPKYDSRDRMVGYYDVEEFSNTYNDFTYYSMRVTKYGYDEIQMSNFYAVDITIRAYVSHDKITIPLQIVNDYEVEGVGTFIGNGLDLNYTVKDLYEGTRRDFCETKAVLE